MNSAPSTQHSAPRSKPVVGIIGGIGSGKSLVAKEFAELGAAVIDADRLGHEALRQAEIRAQVVGRWGREVLDETGAVNRRRLAAIVFSDPAERAALEAMVFPWISRRIHEELGKAEQDAQVPLVVLDAAILLETGWGDVCDYLVYVDAPRERRLERIAAQRGWSVKEVEAREKAQMSVEEKAARADAVVDNSGDPANTRKQVQRLFAKLQRPLPHRI